MLVYEFGDFGAKGVGSAAIRREWTEEVRATGRRSVRSGRGLVSGRKGTGRFRVGWRVGCVGVPFVCRGRSAEVIGWIRRG